MIAPEVTIRHHTEELLEALEATTHQQGELLEEEEIRTIRIRMTTETETTVTDLADIGTTNNEVPITTTEGAEREVLTTEWIASWTRSSA